ncbi:hypothetical protein WJX75_008200 [Coccomyxa subellipsoidea]|uniref:Glycosyltransferase 2-like domain-containing protein n=1 Tax=Coccomyxa subellipsoidea TaxID=248742 RepID=A0ABR2YB32_9CHLO
MICLKGRCSKAASFSVLSIIGVRCSVRALHASANRDSRRRPMMQGGSRMLAGVPLLQSQRLNRPTEAPTSCWLAPAARLAVALLICTNLLYLLFTPPAFSCDGPVPCHTPALPIAPQAGRVTDIAAAQAALPAVVRGDPSSGLLFPDHHFAVFIIFSWNYELFWSSLQTYMAAGWGKRVIIIDNSPDRIILNDPGVVALVGEVIPTRVRLTFSQAQNMIGDIALERNYTFFFWGHSDVALLASNASALFAQEVMACMDKVVAERPKWGVVFFRYDWFSATRTEVVREIKYDTFITVYKSDCDYYPRVRQKWRTLNHSSVCKDCGVQVLEMKRGLKLPLDDYQTTKEMLTTEVIADDDRNRWKNQQWSIGEQIGWELWEHTSWHYFRYKWGATASDELQCKIELPLEGEPSKGKRLRQQPFETVRDLLPSLMRYTVNEADLDATVRRMQRMF